MDQNPCETSRFLAIGILTQRCSTSRNETQKRTFDPYDLVLAPDDDWCLIGHCHLRNDIRLYKVQRVRSSGGDGGVLLPPGRLQGQGLHGGKLRHDPGRWRLPRRATVHPSLRRPDRREAVARGPGRRTPARRHVDTGPQYKFYTSCKKVVEPQPDGTSILRLHVNDLRLIKRWAMFWGPECEVVEPGELKAMITCELQTILSSCFALLKGSD